MTSTIDLMKELDYPANEKGVCWGIALMAEKARRIGCYQEFVERRHYLKGIDKNSLKPLIQAANARLKANQPLQSHEKILLSINSFFFGIWAYYNPNEVAQFFKTPGPHLSQLQIKQLEELLHVNSPLSIPTVYPFSIELVKQQRDKGKHLLYFLHAVKKSAISVGLVITSGTHAVHLFYDKKEKKWFLTNEDVLTHYRSIKQVLNPLVRSFTKNNIANIAILPFTAASPKKQLLLNQLNTINDAALQAFYKSKQINKPSSKGITLLSVAAQFGHTSTTLALSKLLDNKALNYSEINTATPLWMASQNNHLQALKPLLEKLGTQALQKTCFQGHNALWIAAQNGNLEIVQSLAAYADIKSLNQANNEGCTPLSVAAQNGHLEVVRFLLTQKGINIDKANKHGITPIIIARNKRHPEIVLALSEASNSFPLVCKYVLSFSPKSVNTLVLCIMALLLLSQTSTKAALGIALVSYGIFKSKVIIHKESTSFLSLSNGQHSQFNS